MNWSMMHLRAVGEVAELRLPEHQRLGRVDAVAVLEAERRVLGERAVVDRERGAAPAGSVCSGDVASRRCSASCSTRWRWLKVPRSASCPVRRIGVPSARIAAKASVSACAQSTLPSGCVEDRRRAAPTAAPASGSSVNPSGSAWSASLSARSRSAGTAVSTSRRGLAAAAAPRRRSAVPSVTERRTPARRSSASLAASAAGFVGGDDALGDQAVGPDAARTVGCLAIGSYICGWVKAGSSPSLWPQRR